MSSSADKRAIIAEDERNRRIHEGVGQVNAIFNNREGQYDQYLQALRDRYSASLGDQKTILDRNSRFATARRGVTGGSSDYDTQTRNRKKYISALIGAEDLAQGQTARLRQADEGSRQSLINLIYGGMDASSAAQRAGYSARSNIAMGQSDFIPYALDAIGEAGADAYGIGARKEAYQQGGEAARRQLYG